jgi:hypothetical protein
MTDKEKLEKIKQLADTMYNKMQNLTTDTSGIRKAMDDYHQFIIYQYYKEEPVSEELEEACEQLAENARKHKAETSSPFFNQTDYRQGVIDGAKWQKLNLWKPADGDDLPEYDREVIVLTQTYPLKDSEYAVYFAHRPDPKGWDGKSITTGKVEHYTPKTYDKGGWNIPDVKYWVDCSIPKEIEQYE